MEKCLFFSQRFGLSKMFELHGMPESSYLSIYEAHHNKGTTQSQKKSNPRENNAIQGNDEQKRNQRRPCTYNKVGMSKLDNNQEHVDKIVKIQSRMRGVIGRQNSDKLRLEKELAQEEVVDEYRNKRNSSKKEGMSPKPRRSSIHYGSSRRASISISVIATATTSTDEGSLDDKAVKIQKRIRGVIGRQNSEKMKIERSKRRSSVM